MIIRVLQFRKENEDEEEPAQRGEEDRGGEADGGWP
jgi:hypothetical protein